MSKRTIMQRKIFISDVIMTRLALIIVRLTDFDARLDLRVARLARIIARLSRWIARITDLVARLARIIARIADRMPRLRWFVARLNVEVMYLIRAPEQKQVQELYKRVYYMAKGAALMIETTFETEFVGTASNLIPNTTQAEVMYKHLTAIGTPSYDAENLQFARDIQARLSVEDINADLAGLDRETAKQLRNKAIVDIIPPLAEERALIGSTDVGDVSWIAPTMQCITASWALGTPFHTWQVVSQGVMPIAHKGMLQIGKVIASTVIDAMENEEIIEKAKSEWKERLDQETYVSFIPEDVMSPKG